MASRVKVVVVAGVAVVAGGLALALWGGASAFRPQKVTLPDGTVLTLASVQGGLNHIDPFASPLDTWLARVPDKIARRLKIPRPANPWGTGGTNETLSVWLTSTKPPTGGGGQAQFGVAVGDPEGSGYGGGNGQAKTGTVLGGSAYEGHQVRIFPRRSKRLRVRVYASPWDLSKLVHEFEVPNPLGPVETPPFEAKPLPQVSRDGDLEATLELFRVGPPDWPKNADPAQRSTRLEFTLRQAGQPTTNWVSYHVDRVSDATGNSGDGNNWNHGWKDGRSFVEFSRWPLPTVEPWRIRVEFCQQTGFPTNEVWHIAGVPVVPGAGFEPRTNVLHGHKVILAQVGPPRWGGGGRSEDKDREVEIQLKAEGKPDDRRWHMTIVKAVDSTGRDVTSRGWSGSDDDRHMQFRVSREATTADFWVAYAPSRMLEFVALPSTNGPAGQPEAGE